MPGPLAVAALAGGASLIGGVIANKANQKEASKNRKFQERMRNTQWQAGVEDMRRAGLNPALAYSQGGATAPSGSVAADQKNVVESGVSSALDVRLKTAQLKLLDEQAKKTTVEGVKVGTENQLLINQNMMSGGRLGFYFSGDGKPKPALLDLIRAEHGATIANSGKSVSELKLSQLSQSEMKTISALFDEIGSSGKGVQMIMPLIISLLSKR